MSHRTALFVTKDIKPFRMLEPIARHLSQMGWEVKVAAEGVSLPQWRENNYKVFAIDESFGVYNLIYQTNPDLVVCGLSSPINLEAQVLQAAQKMEKTVTVLSDSWCCYTRMRPTGVLPDLVLNVDNVDLWLMKNDPDFAGINFLILGEQAAASPIPQKTREAVSSLEGLPIVVAVPGKFVEMADEVTRLVLSSVKITLDAGGKVVIIPCFRPNLNADLLKQLQSPYLDFAAAYGKDFIRMDISSEHQADHLAQLATAVIASTGTLLSLCATSGGLPICISLEQSRQLLKKEMDREEHPLVTLGLGVALSQPIDLRSLIEGKIAVCEQAQDELLVPIAYDPLRAAATLAAIAS